MQELNNLSQILQGDSDLNTQLTAEAKKKFAQVKQKLQGAYIHQLDLTIE